MSADGDRLKNTRIALQHAMNCAIQRIGPADLQTCFGELSDVIGADLGSLTIQMLEKTHHHVQEEFNTISSSDNVFQSLDLRDEMINFDSDSIVVDNLVQKYEDEISFLQSHVSEEKTEHDRLVRLQKGHETNLDGKLSSLRAMEDDLKQSATALNA